MVAKPYLIFTLDEATLLSIDVNVRPSVDPSVSKGQDEVFGNAKSAIDQKTGSIKDTIQGGTVRLSVCWC